VLDSARLALAIAHHELTPCFDEGLARVAWNGLEHEALFVLAEQLGMRKQLQRWLLHAAACQLALATRAGTPAPIVLRAKRTDFGRFDVEHAAVVWGVDLDLLVVDYSRQGAGVVAAAA
jgi:hypothetical protein